MVGSLNYAKLSLLGSGSTPLRLMQATAPDAGRPADDGVQGKRGVWECAAKMIERHLGLMFSGLGYVFGAACDLQEMQASIPENLCFEGADKVPEGLACKSAVSRKM